ncbi:MAG: glycine cleavage system protein H [Anaerolineae bacterium]
MANSNYLEAMVDKFVFRVARDCRYSDADVWAKRVGERVRVGLTDFLQQKSGDVGFVDVKPIGTALEEDDELGAVETIKVDLIVPAPLAGAIVAVNAALAERPELTNSDPYGEGWLAEIEPTAWADFDALPDAETYLPQMKVRAELERDK